MLPGPPDEPTEQAHETGTVQEDFDEAASHASFLEALNEWRRGGSTTTASATTATATTTQKPTIVGSTNRAWAPTQADPAGGALLDGVYDEQAAADSFKNAVAAWRAGTPQDDRPSTTGGSARPSSAFGAQTEVPHRPPIEIKFQAKKLSFVEQMMLKKARSGSAPPLRKPTVSSTAPAAMGGPARCITPEEQPDNDDVMSIVEVGQGESGVHGASAYAVEEPEDPPSDDEGEADDYRVALVITPEWSQGESEEPDNAPYASTPSSTRAETAEVKAPSRDLLRVALDETPDPHGRHVITPSLMHDFEEMERSFCEP